LGVGKPMGDLSKWKLACQCATSDGVPRRSLWVALIVGTVLNLINQGDALVALSGINWFKLALTYCVPYVVCTYGAVSSRMAGAAQVAQAGERNAALS
jgi:hypothetical protein